MKTKQDRLFLDWQRLQMERRNISPKVSTYSKLKKQMGAIMVEIAELEKENRTWLSDKFDFVKKQDE